MSLDKILQVLEAEAAAEIAEIERAAEAEIVRVRAEAEAKGIAAEQKHKPAIEAPLQAERARILNQAKLESLRTVMGTREELMRAALEAAAARLAILPSGEMYERVLERFIREGVTALCENGELRLRVESRDRPLLVNIMQRSGLQATVEEGTTGDAAAWICPGGVVVTSADGRISLANTLSARLQRVATLYRSEIASMLFGKTP
jgi:vacuolar-type H+-ATPase subunit E/Vma4